jgi:O-acetyl-ADP-ribose deacetylase (regulator of RNase III)
MLIYLLFFFNNFTNFTIIMTDIRITIVSLNSDIMKIVNELFPTEMYPNIEPIYGNISISSPHDCIVSPANSFGHMDGGIDRTLSYILMKNYDDNYISSKVREVIREKYSGEQPVGTCILMPTENSRFPFLAHAPTMTVPTNSVRTLNAYYAFKAVLESIKSHNRETDVPIKSILTTTFCTGCGEMSLKNSLIQMKKAYDIVCDPVSPTWIDAHNHNTELRKIKNMGYSPRVNEDSDFKHIDLNLNR